MNAPESLLDRLMDDAVPIAVLVGGLVLGLLIQRLVLPRLAKLAKRSPWQFDDELIEAIKWPLVLWMFLLGARIALRIQALPPKDEDTIATVLLVLGMFSVTWAIARFAAAVVIGSVTRNGLTGASLLAAIARVVVFIIGLLVVLQQLGIKIGPIIGALGVGGLAVGLALQDTLANIFAGIRILLAHRIRAGDPIRLESGQEGKVEDIGWAQTTVRQVNGNLVLVPNNKLATSVTILLSPANDVTSSFTVVHGSDLSKVEQIAKNAGRETLKSVAEGDGTFDPPVRFSEFRDSGIKVSVVLRVLPGKDQAPVVSDFVRRVADALNAAGIRMPQPPAPSAAAGPGAPDAGGTSPAHGPSR